MWRMGAGVAKPANGASRGRSVITRGGIFAYDLILVVLLLLVGVIYVTHPNLFPFQQENNQSDIYKLAVESMWFGCLGGVIISLKGIYDHSDHGDAWDPEYNLWHLGRPASGAIAGLITVVLLSVVDKNGLSKPAVYAAAFVFGTQERRFFNFLYEVAKLVVQVPDEAASSALQIADVQPIEGLPGAVIVIKGQGFAQNATITLGGTAIQNLVLSSDGSTAAGIIPSPPAGADTVDVTVANPNGQKVSLQSKFKFANAQAQDAKAPRLGAALVHNVGVDLVAAGVAYGANCTDELWLGDKVDTAVVNWMVAARKISKPTDLDTEKKFSDYQMAFPTFRQMCSDISDTINNVLQAEPCKQRLKFEDDWCLQHQNDQIDRFEDNVVKLLTAPAEVEA